MKAFKKTCRGGGRTKGWYKPLIASTLALTLSNVALAEQWWNVGVNKNSQHSSSQTFISEDGLTYNGQANGQPDGSKFGTIIVTNNNSYGILFNLENSRAKMKGDLVFSPYTNTDSNRGDIIGIRIYSKGNTLVRNSVSRVIKIQFQGLAPSSGNPNAKSYVINNNGGGFTLGEGIQIITGENPNLNDRVAILNNQWSSKVGSKDNLRNSNNYLFENGSSTIFSRIADSAKDVAGILTSGASVHTNFELTGGSQVTFKEINASNPQSGEGNKQAFGIYSNSEGNFNLKLNEGSTLTFEKIIGESYALGILQDSNAWDSKHILKDSTLHFKHIEAKQSNVEGLLNRGHYALYELSNSTIQFDRLKSGESGLATGLVGGSKDGTFYNLSNNSHIIFNKIEGNKTSPDKYTSARAMYFNENTNFNLDSSSYILFKEITSNSWMSIISLANQANVTFNGGKILFDQITSTSQTASIELVSLGGTITLGNDAQILFGKTSIENKENQSGSIRGIVYSGTISGNGSIIFTDKMAFTSLAYDNTNHTQNFFNGAKIYADSVSNTFLRAGANATLNVNLNHAFYGGTLEEGAKLAITGDSSSWRNLNLTMGNGAKLVLNSRDTKSAQVDLGVIDNLKGLDLFVKSDVASLTQRSHEVGGNTIIDISSDVGFDQTTGEIVSSSNTHRPYRENFRTLKIGDKTKDTSYGLNGNNLVFRLYANDKGADQIIVDKVNKDLGTGGTPNQTHYYQLVFDSKSLPDLKRYGFSKDITLIKVAEGYKDNVTFKDINRANLDYNQNVALSPDGVVKSYILSGYEILSTDVKEGEEGNYKTYFIPHSSKVKTEGFASAYTDPNSQAMISTYQLYLANLNSLNKRMGELRDNDKANGVWLRVLNGKQSVDFGVETQSTYTTIQGGYDSNFGGKDSNFYLGLALSYSNALSDFNSPNQAQNSVILSNNANGMEAGIYAAYVADSGFYTDTVAKFSFISNDFKSNKNENYKPRVLGGTLSQEVGYRFKLPLNFFIDPQGELSLGYLGGQSFTQSTDGSFLQTSQDGIFTLRGRLGVNWGFDFQEFTQDKEMNAKLYLGTYYVGDYIHGGSITFDNLVDFSDKTNKYSSSGAFLLNVGTNISLKDHTRLYLDFEKSFGGKIRTDYQVNVGVRYSFGEKVRQQEATSLPAPQALNNKKSS